MTPGADAERDEKGRRILPFSDEAERGVLGSCLINPGRVIDLCIEQQLAADAFYLRRHQILFDLLLHMHHAGGAIDPVTVGNRLEEMNAISEIGGRIYLDELIDSTPTDLHAEYYIDIVYQKYLRRQIIDYSQESIERCYLGQEDARELLSATEQKIFDISTRQRAGITPWPDLIVSAMHEIEEIMATKRGISGIPSGFADLDRKMMGLKRGEMIILAARPSMGKTSLALNIAERVATISRDNKRPYPVGVFSLEMTAGQLVNRMLCSHARVPSQKLAGGFISRAHHQDLVNAASVLSEAPLYLDDSPGLEAVELVSRARRMKQRYGIELVVIDYLQLMHYSEIGRTNGRQLEVAAISGAMKAMAKSLNIPVLVLSQLSRATETRDRLHKPQLSDLRDSGSIEQDADIVLFLRRPCRIPGDQNSDDRTLAIVDVAKNRNGETGELNLHFTEDFTRFDNRTHEGVDPVDSAPPPYDDMDQEELI
ncbi:MAG: replicative DNA helicase [Kiritimatiellae bacterium]|nr:replicative DNA helicase [Kiritimatiellia bacterium]MDD4735462.1 replicative DNA helicase [Kiritimatiellia bacterium]